mgnify:CR=1 FL=1
MWHRGCRPHKRLCARVRHRAGAVRARLCPKAIFTTHCRISIRNKAMHPANTPASLCLYFVRLHLRLTVMLPRPFTAMLPRSRTRYLCLSTMRA